VNRRPVMAAALLSAVIALGACGGGEEAPRASDFEGAWNVTLVVGAVDADPGADPASFPGDASFRERWVFEDCDDEACTLRRPDGGLLLGDLDGVPFEVVTGLDQEERFVGEGQAAELPRPDQPDDEAGDDDPVGGAGPEVPEEEADHAEPGEDVCAGTSARRWSVRVELSVSDRVLSGTILRRPEARQLQVGEVTCYGLDLTLGFSGVPAAVGPTTTSE